VTGVERRLAAADLSRRELDLEARFAQQGVGIRDRVGKEEVAETGREELNPVHPCPIIGLYTLQAMTISVSETLAPPAAPPSPLEEVLQRVNRIRVAYGVDPLYELPVACTAWEGGGCVLERAFDDIGVVMVDYGRAYGRGIEFEHGLGDFVRDFDSGRYPPLLAGR
jgi:hypothetical protein